MEHLARIAAEVSEYQAICDRGFDLWTWLPSYQKACEEHGDYATEHAPSLEEILTEACDQFAKAKAESRRAD